MGLVWFARYCGKMYSRHLFSYGGLIPVNKVIVLLLLMIRLSQLYSDYSLLTTRSKRINYLKKLLQEKVCTKEFHSRNSAQERKTEESGCYGEGGVE